MPLAKHPVIQPWQARTLWPSSKMETESLWAPTYELTVSKSFLRVVQKSFFFNFLNWKTFCTIYFDHVSPSTNFSQIFSTITSQPTKFSLKKKKSKRPIRLKKKCQNKTKWSETKSPQKYYSVYFWSINNFWAWGLPCSVVDISTPLENWCTLHQRVSTTESFLVSSESPCLLPSQAAPWLAGTCTDPAYTASVLSLCVPSVLLRLEPSTMRGGVW